MKEVSLLLLVPRGGLEDLARAKSQAISWSQKALDVVIDTRQSHKANFGCDSAYLELLYHLAMLYKVSVFFVLVYFLFLVLVLYIDYMCFSVCRPKRQSP